jgi:hypothetical protein
VVAVNDIESRVSRLESKAASDGCAFVPLFMILLVTAMFFWSFWWQTEGFRKPTPPAKDQSGEIWKRMPAGQDP